jgi:hypothetical protein
MFAELHMLDGSRIAVNSARVLYVAGSGEGNSFLHYGLLHGALIHVAEDFDAVVSLLNSPRSED